MNVGDVDLFEWTAIANFPGYELRVAPSLELKSVGDTTIRKYDSKQDVYARANLVSFDDADGNPVDPEFWPEIKNNVETFRDGYAEFELMLMQKAGFYKFSYELVNSQGEKLFPDFDQEGETYDVNLLPPVSIKMDNIPEILPR